MKVVIVGEDAPLARTVAAALVEEGHHATVVPLGDDLAGAQVVVDVTDSPSYDGRVAWPFLSGATADLLTAASEAGVGHVVAPSVVGTGRLLTSSYFRAKAMREQSIADAGIPYSIVRGTLCYESLGRIADAATDGDRVRVPVALMQPIAAEDLGYALAAAASGVPVDGICDVAGPHRYPLDELLRAHLRAHNDTRRVRAEPKARFLGAKLDEDVLLPGHAATVYPTSYADWLARNLTTMAH
jgi:uncharacterized protein YbjT (DUF2867 family)